MIKRRSKKDKILDVAAHLFSQNGYSKTALEEIASECKITKPAIYYHFKDKQELYEAVICKRFALISEKIVIETKNLSPTQAIEAYVKTFGYYLIEDIDFGAIFARELADGANSLPKKCIKNLSIILERLDEILLQGQKLGIFQKENPFMIQLMIVSTLTNYQTTHRLRKDVLAQIDGEKEHINPDLSDIINDLAQKIKKALVC